MVGLPVKMRCHEFKSWAEIWKAWFLMNWKKRLPWSWCFRCKRKRNEWPCLEECLFGPDLLSEEVGIACRGCSVSFTSLTRPSCYPVSDPQLLADEVKSKRRCSVTLFRFGEEWKGLDVPVGSVQCVWGGNVLSSSQSVCWNETAK